MATRKRSREDAWRAFAEQNGGDVQTDRRGRVKQVRIGHGPWNVMFDTYTVSTGKSSTTYTRARALVHARSPFRFTLYRENVLTRVGRLFGMQDIHSGHPDVDEQYVVKSDNESVIRSLLMDPAVRAPLLAQKDGRFDLAKFRGRFRNRAEGVSELRFQTARVLKDEARLAGILELLRAALDGLARVGATRRSAVDYAL